MKKHSKLYSALAVMAITTIMATSPFFASDVQASDKPKTTTITQSNEVVTMKGGYSILGSKFIGMEVENPQGENLGEIKDIMIDSTGRVRYAAVSYGGFMGMGDKMYAVPLDAFTFKREKDMFFDDVTLILNVTQEQLKDDKGFDNKNWPNLDDEGYRKDLDTRYNIKKSR
jgi:sporulation protein YlmC with PRC-barrel domain